MFSTFCKTRQFLLLCILELVAKIVSPAFQITQMCRMVLTALQVHHRAGISETAANHSAAEHVANPLHFSDSSVCTDLTQNSDQNNCSGISNAAACAPRSVLYRSRAKHRLISIKVHDETAFEKHLAMAASVKQHLRDVCSANTKGLLQIDVTSWKGCLQMIISITEDCNTSLNITNQPTSEDLHGVLQLLLNSAKPSACLLHSPSDGILIQSDKNIKQTSTGSHVQPILNTSSSPSGMRLHMQPFCVESGLDHAVVQDLTISTSAQGINAGQAVEAGIPIEVVACFQQMGQKCVRKLRCSSYDTEARLNLPANISPGPFMVCIINCQPGHEGALLGSLTTVALPQPAAQELQQLLDQHSADPQLHTGFLELLHDMATVWNMIVHREQEAQDLRLLQDLLDYFSGDIMDNCFKLFNSLPVNCHSAGQEIPAPSADMHDPQQNLKPDSSNPDLEALRRVESEADSAASPVCEPSSSQRITQPVGCSDTSRPCKSEVSEVHEDTTRAVSILATSLKGFTDHDLELEYTRWRGDATLAMGWVGFLWCLLIMVSSWGKRRTYYLQGAEWCAVADGICWAMQALLVSPMRSYLASSTGEMLTVGGKIVGALVRALAQARGWIVMEPAFVRVVTSTPYHLLACLVYFPLVYQTRFSGWLVAAAAAECIKYALVYAAPIGLTTSCMRMLPVHILGVAVVVRMDMGARTSFLRQRQKQQMKKVA